MIGMKYFITGGAGFIGSNFVDFLLTDAEGVSKVTIFDKFTYASNIKNLNEYRKDTRLEIIRGDICDSNALNKALPGHDVVVNFAAESHVDRSIVSASPFTHSNVLGAQNVLESSKVHDIGVLLHVSTDEVYGSLTTGLANEESRLLPNSPYAASKASADLFARSYAVTHDLDVRVTRCCNNFGRFQYPEKFIPLIVKNLSDKRRVPIYGTGNNVREWIHVLDHCRAIQMVINRGIKGEIYNIGSGVELSNNALVHMIVEIMDADMDLLEYVEDRKGHDFRYSLDSSKIKNLGFSYENNFVDRLKETIYWYLKNPNWWSN